MHAAVFMVREKLPRNVASPDFRELTVQCHQDLVDVLRAREPAPAIAMIEDHLRGTYERILPPLFIQQQNRTP